MVELTRATAQSRRGFAVLRALCAVARASLSAKGRATREQTAFTFFAPFRPFVVQPPHRICVVRHGTL